MGDDIRAMRGKRRFWLGLSVFLVLCFLTGAGFVFVKLNTSTPVDGCVVSDVRSGRVPTLFGLTRWESEVETSCGTWPGKQEDLEILDRGARYDFILNGFGHVSGFTETVS